MGSLSLSARDYAFGVEAEVLAHDSKVNSGRKVVLLESDIKSYDAQ